jgi:hypothetical protein
MLIPVAASMNSCPCSYDPDRQNITASRCRSQENPHGGRFSTPSRGNSDPAPLIPDRYPIRRTTTAPSRVTTVRP